MMAQQQAQPSSMDEQIALLEKSYELAAKYMPGGQNVGGQTAVSDQEDGRKAAVHNGNAVAMPVGTVTSQTVSSLPQPMSDAEFVAGYTTMVSIRRSVRYGREAGTPYRRVSIQTRR